MNQLTFFSETTVPLKRKLGWNINLEWACRQFCADWKSKMALMLSTNIMFFFYVDQEFKKQSLQKQSTVQNVQEEKCFKGPDEEILKYKYQYLFRNHEPDHD